MFGLKGIWHRFGRGLVRSIGYGSEKDLGRNWEGTLKDWKYCGKDLARIWYSFGKA